MWWPRLEKDVNSILSQPNHISSPSRRPDREILDEALQLTRMLSEKNHYPDACVQISFQGLLDELDNILFVSRIDNPETADATSKKILMPLQHISATAGVLDVFEKFAADVKQHPIRHEELISSVRKRREEKQAKVAAPEEDDIRF
jgi:hypothetical protein